MSKLKYFKILLCLFFFSLGAISCSPGDKKERTSKERFRELKKDQCDDDRCQDQRNRNGSGYSNNDDDCQ